jgi:hypothetical protein
MRLLILGALGPYPERVRTFLNHQHQLWYVSTLGSPAPLAGVTTYSWHELAASAEQATVRLLELIDSERIEAVYSLLNVWDGSNAVTALLLQQGCPVPVIRHYKEHYLRSYPDEQICIEQSTGVLFINPESQAYFGQVYQLPQHTACLDADLLPQQYLAGTFQPKLSAQDGQPHLLIAGTVTDDGGRYDYRPLICELTACGAHVHLYGLFRRLAAAQGLLYDTEMVAAAYRALPTGNRLHVHAPIGPEHFVSEWSCYDAGLLHMPRTDDAFRTLNLPNRYSAYLAAGLPVALPAGEMSAMQRQLEVMGAAVIYRDSADLVAQLPNPQATANARAVRDIVTFEAVFPLLEQFLESCLA